MYLKEIVINTKNWIDPDQGLLEGPCKGGTEPPGNLTLLNIIH